MKYSIADDIDDKVICDTDIVLRLEMLTDVGQVINGDRWCGM